MQAHPPLWPNLWEPAHALESALVLYTADSAPALLERQVSTLFLQRLEAVFPEKPSGLEKQREAALDAAAALLGTLRSAEPSSHTAALLAIALRPCLQENSGPMAPEALALLHDFHRGRWEKHFTRPQEHLLEEALISAFASLPPPSLEPLWEEYLDSEGLQRTALLRVLLYFRSAHALGHLLYGLHTSQDHSLRSRIVDILEEISEPASLVPLQKLRREMAHLDWTLSRQMERAVKVIKQQNQDLGREALLRPSEKPLEDQQELLRSQARPSSEDTDLLPRPAD